MGLGSVSAYVVANALVPVAVVRKGVGPKDQVGPPSPHPVVGCLQRMSSTTDKQHQQRLPAECMHSSIACTTRNFDIGSQPLVDS